MPGDTTEQWWSKGMRLDRFVRRPKSPGIGSWLFALGLAAILPVLAFAGLAAWHAASAERLATLTELEHRAEAAANKVERYLQSLRELAVTLAAAPMLRTGDLRSFHEFAKRAMEDGKVGRAIALSDATGQMLINTRRPFGEPLPFAGDVQGVAETVALKAPHIANLFMGAVTSSMVFTVWAPVIRDGQVVLLVGVTVEPQDLTAVLREEQLREGWVGQVLDRRDIIVARTLGPEAVIGQRAVPEAAAAHARGMRGAYSLVTRGGVPVSAYFIKLPTTGWTTALGLPKAQLEAPVAATQRIMLQLGLATLALASMLAFLVGRHMSRQVAAVAQAAMAVGEGRELARIQTGVRELDAVAGALMAARDQIDAREADLRESEERWRIALRVANQGAWQLDLASHTVWHSLRHDQIFGYDTLQPEWNYEIFLRHVLEEDRGLVQRCLKTAKATYRDWSFECRIRRADGAMGWILAYGQTLHGHDGRPARMFGLVADITERKLAEEHAALLMKEVNHRAKNLLAVVQAVALQTAGEESPKVFAARFSDRLAGLAASHDLLVQSEWQGVDVSALVTSQLAHFKDLIGARVILQGQPLQLRASAAQSIGMAVHELATNAAKYGSLSTAEGSIRIDWEILEEKGNPLFRMRWSERGGPPPTPSPRQGYGHKVITDMIEYTLGAAVSLQFPLTGAVWELTAPAARIREGDPNAIGATGDPGKTGQRRCVS